MTREWIEPIFDRTYGNVQDVQYNPDQQNPKGCWNAVDLNRIEKNTAYCAEWMVEQKIVHEPPAITVREDDYWDKDIIPTKTEIDRILNNIRLLVELSSTNPAIADQLPTIYAATQINYVLANEIEFALYLMHDQPKLPLTYWYLTIENGIVKTIVRADGTIDQPLSSEVLVAEDEVVTIRGIEYGQDAQYQTFSYWSGEPDDIGLLDNYRSQETTFTMPYRDVEFTANFETHIPRMLTLTNGYISINMDPTAESGPSTHPYFAGDQVMIIANVAPSGKAFYEWTGTQEGLDNLVGATQTEDPSTAILTMPDCDVSLEPRYINAGQHSVTVTGGNGSGWYNYQDYVSISATVPNHYAFSHWSGNTSYLSDIYSSYQSFRMGDVNISFTAHFNYVYSYNDVQVIDGLIRVNNEDVSSASGLMQTSSYTLVPTPPNGYGLYNWTIEGYGSVGTDSLGNCSNTFTVGDGNAIITGNYTPLQTINITNVDNNGELSTTYIAQGRKMAISTTQIVGDYIFVNWTEGEEVVSTSTYYSFTANSNRNIRANYRLRNYVNVTIDYGNHIETVVMQERSSKSIVADPAASGYHFSGWESSGLWLIGSSGSSSTYIVAGSGDAAVRATYTADTPPSPPVTYYNLTVNNGSGSGSGPANSYFNINGNQAPSSDYEFDHWELDSGTGASISNVYAKQTTCRIGASDAVVTAHYRLKPTFTVKMQNGYIWNGTTWVEEAVLPRDSTNEIQMKPAPTGHQFLQWEVIAGGSTDVDANDVLLPLAERTRLRSLSRDLTIRATYYVPDPEVKYTLTIERKDGSVTQNDYSVGTDVHIYASSPDQGMEFYKWTGATAYIAGGSYNANTYVHMPAQNISIKENYVPEGFIPGYDLEMTNIYGQCCYETTSEDPNTHETIVTEHWVSRWTYQEGTVVKIRAIGIPGEYYFNEWTAINHDTSDDARSLIKNLASAETTVTIPEYDIDMEPLIALKDTYELRINDGGTSGYYYEGARADIYFNKENTNDIHYQFLRWTGSNVSQLELYDGGMFSVLTPGDETTPQYIKMPAQRTEVTATYKTFYRLTLTNGIIDSSGEREGFYETGTTLSITAQQPASGMRFQYWTGDTSRVTDIYDSSTTLTTTNGVTNLTAVYSNDADRNAIGYVNMDLRETTSIGNSLIQVISGEIEVGFILTDSIGHIYIITNIDEGTDTSTIYRMTKIVKGGNIYG